VASRPVFQLSTNRNASAVFGPVQDPTLLLARLQLLLQVRACALLELGRNAEAAEDVLTGLRLAGLTGQVPDPRSTVRAQTMLARSMQPLWEGFRRHAWTEPQVAALQNQLATFNLLADYTNAVRRVVLAHIALWRAIPDRKNTYLVLPASDGGHMQDPLWEWQPRDWWFANCIQLHEDEAGRQAIELVDMAAGRMGNAADWSDLSGLPLDSLSQQLLEQSAWWGPNPASVAFVQTSVSQATAACALERFRLLHGAYPDTLQSLVPALLDRIPHDAVSGRPIIYQSLGESAFILRGVGPNGTDDRNKPASDDWLWAYSTNSPSAKR
jgi:hypothetical protein